MCKIIVLLSEHLIHVCKHATYVYSLSLSLSLFPSFPLSLPLSLLSPPSSPHSCTCSGVSLLLALSGLCLCVLTHWVTRGNMPLVQLLGGSRWSWTMVKHGLPYYGRKYWRELNLTVEPKIATTTVLVDLNLTVPYGIAKYWLILIWT